MTLERAHRLPVTGRDRTPLTSPTKEHRMTPNAAGISRIRGSLAAVDGAGTVRLEGRFAGRIGDVWSALTEPGRLGEWLGEVDGDLRSGGELRARFLATGWEGTGRVEVCEPPRRLLVLTRSADEPECTIEVTLVAYGEQTVVVVEDRGLPLQQIAAYGAGDQVLVEGLAAYLAGHDRCDVRARWQELHPAYQDLAAALT
jgi:uncharacterized protein YndB with AHSA1/START domain